MKIAIIGYGKMGKEVERLALEKGHVISGIVNKSEDAWPEADVAIEFSTPENCLSNYQKAFDLNMPIVSGTTGWYEHIDEIKDLVEGQNKSFLYASNFSIGVNLFFKVNRYLAKLMNKHRDYICQIDEIHHTEKKDAPSGTAITIADDIIEQSETFKSWVNEDTIENNILPILSHREKWVPGTHVVSYQNEIDALEIKHVAKNREGFALGAIFAAEWIHGKIGFFTMNDVML
ncbi:MAG: 4-hydroxy-tetrahydrodipicolinate reductase [Patiriisocius sp.]